jgi:hypothetical protein
MVYNHEIMDANQISLSDFQKLYAENKERLKELACINRTTQIMKEGKSLEDTLQQICLVLPSGWQYPRDTVARISYDGLEFTTPDFEVTESRLSQRFETISGKKGRIEVYYLEKYRHMYEGAFLLEERHLIDNLANNICNYINTVEARVILKKTLQKENFEQEILEYKKDGELNSRQLLQTFLNKYNANRDIFHDLQPFKVKEILLVATLYDAYSIEKEGRFTEHMLGEYHQFNLTSMPRITGVTTYEEALARLREKHYDMVILIVGTEKRVPLESGKRIKKVFPYVPVYMLLNNNREMEFFSKHAKLQAIDRIFIWNGDSKVFFAMVKHLEDKVNVENDTRLGSVKVILLVEDSEKYYSRYLPLLYNSVMDQTRRLMQDVSTDELYKVLRYRARPKVLLATSWEEAITLFNKYRDHLLCLITDVKFKKKKKLNPQAGFELVKHIKNKLEDLPVIIQSSDPSNSHKAYELKAIFINKNSDSLIQDIKSFVSHYLGFGNFIYRDAYGKKIAEARSLKEFEGFINTIPAESLLYHGRRNHFSLWLMARGEIRIARMINPIKVTDFQSPSEFRSYLQFVISKYRNETSTGRIVNFDENALLDESSIVSLGTGGLGGKGRGLAFINTLINNISFSNVLKNINIRTPRTSFIGTDEFDIFIEKNKLLEVILYEQNYELIKKRFVEGELSYDLMKKIKIFLNIVKTPIAIRSSSLFEDSTMQPFSGIFDTFLLPNNHDDFHIRLNQMATAIKLVYASIYSPSARMYFEAVNYKIEEEKMAVVIQEVVGGNHDGCFYPHISGTAQSHNYYPVAHMEPEDGFAVIATGLGKYVVDGEKSYRFSPKYPTLEIISPKDLFQSSQIDFYALDLSRKKLDLLTEGDVAGLKRLSIYEAEKHGTLKHLASVYDPENDQIEPGLLKAGPRIMNFADILKYQYIPMANTLEVLLEVFKEALGAPVELEFAIDLDKKNGAPSFYILQMKPLVDNPEDYAIDHPVEMYENRLLFAEKSLGNGRLDTLSDVVFVKPQIFNKLDTEAMAEEIGAINRKMKNNNIHYILMGPGRWGTRDKFIGIPVNWPQISNARIIIEIGLENFPLDASLGSHFFHNVTSMNVGYFSVPENRVHTYIDWSTLKSQKTIFETKYFRHIRFQHPLTVLMDGRKRVSLILTNG